MSDTQKAIDVIATLSSVGALWTGSHIIYTSGRHGESYVNKDAIYPHTAITSRLCGLIADKFKNRGIEVVLAPAIGGVILSQWIAHHLTGVEGREVLSVYAEKTDGDAFIIKRGYDKLIHRKRVLIVEDILTTGGSVRKVVDAARLAGAEILAVAALCNRGAVTTDDIGKVPELFALATLSLTSWDPAECPLCTQKVPINTDVGKGKA